LETSRTALTLDEALPVIAEAMSDNTVLVGGQAVNLWAVLLRVEVYSPFLTRDIDLVGDRKDALLADKRITLPHKLFLASLDDSSINAAVIAVHFPGDNETTPIDYLMTLYGLDRDKIESSAINVAIDELIIRVIHPILLLQSKICNLNLKSKRTVEARLQAQISIAIVRAFLDSTLMNQKISARKNLNMLRQVTSFSKSIFAVAAYKEFGIDTMDALPVTMLDSITNPTLQRFRDKGLPQSRKHLARFRA
jgi:hypothetical protein